MKKQTRQKLDELRLGNFLFFFFLFLFQTVTAAALKTTLLFLRSHKDPDTERKGRES